MSVGTEIRRRRQEQGLTGAQLAARAGLAPSAVSQIETGRRTPNSGSVVKLAEALGVQVGDLYPKATPSLFELIEPHLKPDEKQRRLKEEWDAGAQVGIPVEGVFQVIESPYIRKLCEDAWAHKLTSEEAFAEIKRYMEDELRQMAGKTNA